MTSNSRIPQHVAPYVQHIPKDSLILLTSTLSNSANWLVVRYLCGAFSNDAVKARRPPEPGDSTTTPKEDVGVVLVSWMRDWEFWKNEARRSGALDLASLSQNKRFVFVDGLSSSTPTPESAPAAVQATKAQSPTRTPPTNSTLPTRGPLPGAVRSPAITPGASAAAPSAPTTETSHTQDLPSLELSHIQRTIEAALSSLSTNSAILILDAPDLLLALQDPTSTTPSASRSTSLQSLILALRLQPHVHATILNLSSDMNPLPSAPRPEHHTPTPLEAESQALLVGLAHTADLVVSARGLDTGAAGDVGGVLRVTAPPHGGDSGEDGGVATWKQQELLYLVKIDGSAKVWERGAGVGVG